jgi:hypothetical protein
MASFARTPGKDFVIPRNSNTGGMQFSPGRNMLSSENHGEFSDGYLINKFLKKGRVYSRPFEHNKLII